MSVFVSGTVVSRHALISSFYRLSKSTCLWAFIAPSLAFSSLPPPQQPPFQPKGAVLGNVDKLEDMNPRVVFEYLASCAHATTHTAPLGSGCLLENYIDEQFPGPTWGHVCSPPEISMENITANLVLAAARCPEDIENDVIQTASVFIMKVLAVDSCWEELCERDDISLRIESQYIETCSNIQLPYPVESAMVSFPSDDEPTDVILTCMLDYVMDTPPSEFGLEDSSSPCYPPGYRNITAVCSSALAQQAFDECTDVYYFMFEDDRKFSFDYEMSMNTDRQDDDEREDFSLLAKFCRILEGLSAERGLECLDQICQPLTPAPSASPSEVPSLPPGSPMASPTGSPTGAPAVAPTALPIGSPTVTPTPPPVTAPSKSPTRSFSPHTAPSSSPAVVPSASPKGFPTVSPTPPPTAPSKSPTRSSSPPTAPSKTLPPAARPSKSPTPSPTLSKLQSIVEIELVSEFALNVSSSGVSASLPNTVESAIEKTLSSIDVNATILTIEGTPVSRRLRRLQNLIEVEFSVEAVEECYVSNCTAFATDLIAKLDAALAGSIADGSMTASLKREAVARNVTELTSSVIQPGSYRLVQAESQLTNPVVVANQDATQSSAALVSTVSILGLSFLMVPLLIL